MTLKFSDHVIAGMGFRQLGSDEVISARFHALQVVELEGVTVGACQIASLKIRGRTCSMAIAKTVNEACQALLSDDYTEDEPDWERQRQCHGPYLLIAFGLTELFEVSSGWIRDEADGSVTTYDCFPAAKDLAQQEAQDIFPELLTALICRLLQDGRSIRSKVVDAIAVGITPANRMVRDIRFQLNARVVVSTALSDADVGSVLSALEGIAEKLDPKVARFFKLALLEDDELKRFLYYFLALEVQIHRVFQGIDHAACVSTLISSMRPIHQSSLALLERFSKEMKGIKDRFVWCALWNWKTISDNDVERFTRLKKVRDRIAHGVIDYPTSESVRDLQTLVAKVLLQ